MPDFSAPVPTSSYSNPVPSARRIVSEDGGSIVFSDGTVVAKTPEIMAPGGIYESSARDAAQAAASPAVAPTMPGLFDAPPTDSGLNLAAMPQSTPMAMEPAPAVKPLELTTPSEPPAPKPQLGMPGVGGMIPMTKTGESVQTKSIDSTLYNKGIETLVKSEEAKVKADTAEIEAKAAETKFKAEQDASIAEQLQADREANNIVIADRQKKIADEIEAIGNTKIDPNAFFNNKSTGDKILAALAVGMGTYGAAMSGGENVAFKIIKGAIDNDIDAQKANLANRRAAVGDKQNALGQLQQKFDGDLKMAEIVYRAGALENVANKFADMNAKLTSETARAANQIKIDTIRAEAEKLKMTANEKVTVDTKSVSGQGKMWQDVLTAPELTKVNSAKTTIQQVGKLRTLIEKDEIPFGVVQGTLRKISQMKPLSELSPAETEFLYRIKKMSMGTMVDISGTSAAEPLRQAIEQMFPSGFEKKESALHSLSLMEGDANDQINTFGRGIVPRDRSQSPAAYGAKPASK